MAATCEVCGKHPSFGHNISHSHRRTKRLDVCTSCLKAGKVVKAAHH